MTIEKMGGLMFRVSGTKPGSCYILDMSQNGGNGVCSCPDFGNRRQQAWDVGGGVVNHGEAGATRCKHINAVVLSLGQRVVDAARGKEVMP